MFKSEITNILIIRRDTSILLALEKHLYMYIEISTMEVRIKMCVKFIFNVWSIRH